MREILENVAQWGHKPDKEVKQTIDQALSAIKSEMLGKLPQEDCPIIRNKEKRFQCKECSQLRRPCFHMIKNNLLSQIKQIVEEMK